MDDWKPIASAPFNRFVEVLDSLGEIALFKRDANDPICPWVDEDGRLHRCYGTQGTIEIIKWRERRVTNEGNTPREWLPYMRRR
jgi:hypothetical protein